MSSYIKYSFFELKASTHVTLGTGSNDYTAYDSLWLQWGEFFGPHENVCLNLKQNFILSYYFLVVSGKSLDRKYRLKKKGIGKLRH